MRKQRITYLDLARKLLAGNLLRRDERGLAEDVLTIGDTLEEGRRLGDLLERLAGRGALLRLTPPDERSPLRRYLDPASNDQWSLELPGPRPAPPRAAAVPAPAPAPDPGARPAERPRLVQPVDEVDVEPAVAQRFVDERTGEPLRTLFATFAPCNTPEELAEALAPIRAQIVERTSADDVRFHVADEAGVLTPIPFRREAVRKPLLTYAATAARTLHVANLLAPGVDATSAEPGALVSLPLLSGDRRVGVMEVVRHTPGAFDQDELRLLTLTALAAAGAMARAEVLERLIYLDKLTGLYNRAYFDDQIEREIERANRTSTPVALLMADLDHFKRINDTYGHQAGDHALSHLASLIRANIRQIDIAARYGGEEFALLLPATPQGRAVRTAERLRRVVAQSRVGEIIPVLADVRLSISIGLALYPDDAATSEQLIDRADRVALYAAKHRGRDRVVSWAEARMGREPLRPKG